MAMGSLSRIKYFLTIAELSSYVGRRFVVLDKSYNIALRDTTSGVEYEVDLDRRYDLITLRFVDDIGDGMMLDLGEGWNWVHVQWKG